MPHPIEKAVRERSENDEQMLMRQNCTPCYWFSFCLSLVTNDLVLQMLISKIGKLKKANVTNAARELVARLLSRERVCQRTSIAATG